jgi:sRNA-binding carbon storage regulator CsrA
MSSGGIGEKVYLGEDICVMVESIDIKERYVSLEIKAKCHIYPICNESDYPIEMLDTSCIKDQRRKSGSRIITLNAYVTDPIFIGDDITVKLIDIRGIKVILGFIASPDIVFYREQLFQEIQNNKFFLSQECPF